MRKVLIVGCGSIGRQHAANASRIASVAVVDADPRASTTLASALGLEACTSLREGLDRAPDAVVVATPPRTHLQIASAAIESGADVLVEKPLAPDLSGVRAFLDAAERAQRRVCVVCNMRFHPAVQALRQALPLVGRPLFARAHYGSFLPDMRPGADYRSLYCARADEGGGVILDAIHEIDYLTWMFGPVLRVVAEAGRLGELDIDVEDYASLTLLHAGGVRSEVHLDYLQRSKRRGCEIVGTEGTLLWNSEGKQPESCLVRFRPPGPSAWQILFEAEQVDTSHPYRELMRRFLSSSLDADLQDGRDGAAALATALAARQAAREGMHTRPEAIR